MISLEFRDELVNNRFSYYNGYSYVDRVGSGLYFKKTDEKIPYILRTPSTTNIPLLHDVGGDIMEINFSNHSRQLNNRVLTTAKLKEVLDGARCPLLFRIGTLHYLIGKGFLASYIDSTINLLFVATVKQELKYPTMMDITYYISRDVYSALHKKIFPAIKDFMLLHQGDTVITRKISDHIGCSIDLPLSSTLSEKKVYIDNLISMCIDKIGERYPKPVPTKGEVKKAKEKDILGSLRSKPRQTGASEALKEMINRPDVLPGTPIEESIW